MRKDKRNKKSAIRNVPMTLACVLFCLTLLSTHFTSDLYARYTTSDSASDGARVVKFGEIHIKETADFTTIDGQKVLTVAPGVDIGKSARLSFGGSEAETFVFLQVTTTVTEDDSKINDAVWSVADNKIFTLKNGEKNILSWALADGWTYHTTSADTSTRVYYKKLAPNEKLDAVELIAGGKVTVPETVVKKDLAAFDSINVIFKASAVQANGFANASDAWNSVSAS